jgi:hypothetical protein
MTTRTAGDRIVADGHLLNESPGDAPQADRGADRPGGACPALGAGLSPLRRLPPGIGHGVATAAPIRPAARQAPTAGCSPSSGSSGSRSWIATTLPRTRPRRRAPPAAHDPGPPSSMPSIQTGPQAGGHRPNPKAGRTIARRQLHRARVRKISQSECPRFHGNPGARYDGRATASSGEDVLPLTCPWNKTTLGADGRTGPRGRHDH